MNNPSMFLEPIKIRYGSIHAVNLNRKFTDMLTGNQFFGDFVLGKRGRFCLVTSITKSNISNVWVIPIKSKTESNQYPYEIYKEICLKSGWQSLLCISQMTLVPIECIDTREIGALNKSTMDEVMLLIDEILGRRPPSHLEGSEKYAKELEPSIFKIKGNVPDKLVYETSSTPEKTPMPKTKDTRIKEFLTENYQKTTQKKMRKFLYIIQKEILNEYGEYYDIDCIRIEAMNLGYEIKIGANGTPYISGIQRKVITANTPTEPIIEKSDIEFCDNLPGDKLQKIQLDNFVLSDEEVIKKYGLTKAQLSIIKKRNNGRINL